MLALRKTGPFPGVTLEQVPEPVLSRPDHVLIEVAAAGICGTDLHIDHWASAYHHLAAALPLTMGHEFCGRVVQVGPQASVPVGSRVTVVPATSCGHCRACLAGDPDGCKDRKGIGILRDGGFARFVAVPAANCIAVPDGLDDGLAALTEPMAIAENAVANAGLASGERVLVPGPGTIGQGVALAAHRAGAAVTVVGRDDAHRFAVLRSLGFDDLRDAADADFAATAEAMRESYDCVFEASGSGPAFEQGIVALRPGGRMVVVGVHAAPVALDLVRLVRKRLKLVGSFSSPARIWPGVIAAIAAEPHTFAKLITHDLPLADALDGFAAAERREASKVILRPQAV